MFRLKLTLILLGVTIIGVVVTLSLLRGAKTSADEALVAKVQQSHAVYGQVKRLRDLQLRDVAQAVAQSEVGVYLAVLKTHRKTMHRIQHDLFKRVPKGGDPAERRKILDEEYDDVHGRIALDLASRLEAAGAVTWSDDVGRESFVKATRQRLSACQSRSVKRCAYELARGALVGVAQRLRDRPIHGVTPSVLIVADDRNVGLADADRAFYAEDSTFAENFALAGKAREGVISRDIAAVDTESHKGTFFLTAAPVFDAEHRFVGTVLTGAELDSGLLAEEKRILGRDITYFDNNRPIRSTLDRRALERLVIGTRPVDPENPQLHTLQTDSIIAQFVPLTGNWSPNRFSVAISSPRDAARRLDEVTLWIPLVFALLFVFGTALMMWAVHGFLRPAFAIDSGIHEVINGDRDYVFPHDYDSELWVGMSESLNLMVGELVGREMLDEEGFDDWAKTYLEAVHMQPMADVGGEASSTAPDAGRAANADLAPKASSGAVASADAPVNGEGTSEPGVDPRDGEADEDYFQRIYQRFRTLSVEVGVEPMPFPRFVAKVARTERALAQRLGLKQVRLAVVPGAAGPVLKPVGAIPAAEGGAPKA